MEKGKTYYWRSPRDGMYYAVKLINKNEKLKKNNFRIIGWSHPGFLSIHRKEDDGQVVSRHFTDSPTFTDLHLMMIEDIMKMLSELRGMLEEHPDKYFKYLDILSNDVMFDGILEGKYHSYWVTKMSG